MKASKSISKKDWHKRSTENAEMGLSARVEAGVVLQQKAFKKGLGIVPLQGTWRPPWNSTRDRGSWRLEIASKYEQDKFDN